MGLEQATGNNGFCAALGTRSTQNPGPEIYIPSSPRVGEKTAGKIPGHFGPKLLGIGTNPFIEKARVGVENGHL